MQVHARVCGEEGFDLGGGVGAAVVEDQMQSLALGYRAFDLLQESEEFLGTAENYGAPVDYGRWPFFGARLLPGRELAVSGLSDADRGAADRNSSFGRERIDCRVHLARRSTSLTPVTCRTARTAELALARCSRHEDAG